MLKKRALMRKVVMALSLAAIMLGAVALPALAHGQHAHVLLTPSDSDPEVAPATCTSMSDTAFHNFHSNVHIGTPGTFAFDQPNNPVDIRGAGC